MLFRSFDVKGKQRVEFFNATNKREDYNPSTSPSAATWANINDEPQAKQLLSSLNASRWLMNDKSYISLGYQFQHLRNDVLSRISTHTIASPFTSGSRNVETDAQSSSDSHTWVQHFVQNITPALIFVTKLKEEIISNNGSSTSLPYTSGGISSGGSNYFVTTENKISRTGEAVSLRYSGIPKTSLYAEGELQQNRNWLSKLSSSSTTYIENIDRGPEGNATLGMRYSFNSKLNLTSELKYKETDHSYNTINNNDAAMTINRMKAGSDSWSSRLAYKPFKWFENSLRLQLINSVYGIQSKGLDTNNADWIKSQGSQRVYTYNVVLQPLDQWMFDLGYSLNNFKVSTPASQKAIGSSNGGIPVFTANVYTYLLTTSYIPLENLSFYNSIQYARAKNFNNYGNTLTTSSGMPFGVDNENYNITTGIKWSPKKNLSIEPHYAYYGYRANQSLDYGNYSAHVFWLDTKYSW